MASRGSTPEEVPPNPSAPSAGTPATSVRALLAHRDLGLRTLVGADDLPDAALDAAARWVHSSDLSDPTPFLSPDLVLLTTGTQFATDADDAVYDAYVDRLAASGVRAIGFGTEVARDGTPPPLAEACRRHGIPLFEVPYRTPFLAVARVHADAVAAATYARRTWALDAQRAIAIAALRPDGLDATLAELARQLGAWVGLFDASGALTRGHPAPLPEAADTALGDDVGRLLARGTQAGSTVVVDGTRVMLQTIGRGGHLRGVLAIARDELDQEARTVVTGVVALAGLALEQGAPIAAARASLRAGLVAALLSDDARLAASVAPTLGPPLPPEPITVSVLAVSDTRADALAEWLESRLDPHTPLFFGRADADTVVVAPADDDETDAVVEEAARRFDGRVGVSRQAEYATFSRAHAQATTALARSSAAIARFADVAVSGVLDTLRTDEWRAVAVAFLAPLTDHDAAHDAELVATVRAWLAHDARIDAAAHALGIHRHTVRARLATAEQVLGVDLASFPVRADLWAALTALD